MAETRYVITQDDVAASVRKARALHDELRDLAKEKLTRTEQEIFNRGDVIELRLSILGPELSPCMEKHTIAIFEAQLKIMTLAEALKLLILIPENRHLVKGLSSMARQWMDFDGPSPLEEVGIDKAVETDTTGNVNGQAGSTEVLADTVGTSIDRLAPVVPNTG